MINDPPPDIAVFIGLLSQATAAVPEEYFHLRVAGTENPIYRERVYCYELYHQLRSIWPDNYFFYLGGEVDKSGHPILSKGELNRLKPDFLVHTPGEMRGNLIVIEVKPVFASSRDIAEDLSSLSGFLRSANYLSAIYLVYGGDEQSLARFKRRCISQAYAMEVDVLVIDLWWHPAPGRQAYPIEW